MSRHLKRFWYYAITGEQALTVPVKYAATLQGALGSATGVLETHTHTHIYTAQQFESPVASTFE